MPNQTMNNPFNNPFLEQQQKLMETWTQNLSKLPGMESYTNMWKSMTPPNAEEYWKNLTSMMPNASDAWKKLTEAMPNPAEFWKNFSGMLPNAADFSSMWPLPYKIPGMDTFAKVFDLWKGMSDPTTFVQDFQSKYTELMQDLFKNFLPDGMGQFMEKPQHLLNTCVALYQQIFSPWMQLDEELMQRVATGDMGAFHDFFKAFNAKYDETFDKLFNMMGMGLNREANEDQMKAISAYIKMMFITGELISIILDTCRSSMNTFWENYQKDLEQGKMITTFREFYDLWSKVTEDSLLKLFNTDEFAKVFGNFSDRSSQFMIAMNREYERALASLPIPTNKDMKSLYKTVYDLRKEVRDLRRELDAVKSADAKTPAVK